VTGTGGEVRRGEVKAYFQPTLLQLISRLRSSQKFVSVCIVGCTFILGIYSHSHIFACVTVLFRSVLAWWFYHCHSTPVISWLFTSEIWVSLLDFGCLPPLFQKVISDTSFITGQITSCHPTGTRTFRAQDLLFPRTNSPYGERLFRRLFVPRDPGDRKFPGTFVPSEQKFSIGSFRSWERKVLGTKSL